MGLYNVCSSQIGASNKPDWSVQTFNRRVLKHRSIVQSNSDQSTVIIILLSNNRIGHYKVAPVHSDPTYLTCSGNCDSFVDFDVLPSVEDGGKSSGTANIVVVSCHSDVLILDWQSDSILHRLSIIRHLARGVELTRCAVVNDKLVTVAASDGSVFECKWSAEDGCDVLSSCVPIEYLAGQCVVDLFTGSDFILFLTVSSCSRSSSSEPVSKSDLDELHCPLGLSVLDSGSNDSKFDRTFQRDVHKAGESDVKSLSSMSLASSGAAAAGLCPSSSSQSRSSASLARSLSDPLLSIGSSKVSDGRNKRQRTSSLDMNAYGPDFRCDIKPTSSYVGFEFPVKVQDWFKPNVWFLGKGAGGVSGQGDVLDRNQPVKLHELDQACVVQISCGRRHCLAMSVSGSLYAWGCNERGQCDPESISSTPCIWRPRKVRLPDHSLVSDIVAVSDKSAVISQNCKLIFFTDYNDMSNSGCWRSIDVQSQLMLSRPAQFASHHINICADLGDNFGMSVVTFDHKSPTIDALKRHSQSFYDSLKKLGHTIVGPLTNGIEFTHPNVLHLKSSIDTLADKVAMSIYTLGRVFSSVHDWRLLLSCTLFAQADSFCESFIGMIDLTYKCLLCGDLAWNEYQIEDERISQLTSAISSMAGIPPSRVEEFSPQTMLRFALESVTSNIVGFLCVLKNLLNEVSTVYVLAHTQLIGPLAATIDQLSRVQRHMRREMRQADSTLDFWQHHDSTHFGPFANKTLVKLLDELRSDSSGCRRIHLDTAQADSGNGVTVISGSREDLPELTRSDGVSAFSSSQLFNRQRLILMSDGILHCGLSFARFLPLETVWLLDESTDDGLEDFDSNKSKFLNAIRRQVGKGRDTEMREVRLVTPEDAIVLRFSDPRACRRWYKTLDDVIGRHIVAQAGSQNGDGWPDSSSRDAMFAERFLEYNFERTKKFAAATYRGIWLRGRFHGQGQLKWKDKSLASSHDGEWRGGCRHGQGEFHLSSDDDGDGNVLGKMCYKGAWLVDKLCCHDGDIWLPSGDHYHGQLCNGLPCGHGIFKSSSGLNVVEQIEQFFASRRQKTAADGNVNSWIYAGDWNKGLRDGYGVCMASNSSSRYLGHWLSDLRQGEGCLVSSNLVCRGQFSANKMVSKNSLMALEDGTFFEGPTADVGSFAPGVGSLYMPSGDVLTGSFTGSLDVSNSRDGKCGSQSAFQFNGTVIKNKERRPLMASDVNLESKWTSLYDSFFQRHDVCPQCHVGRSDKRAVKLNDVASSELWAHILGRTCANQLRLGRPPVGQSLYFPDHMSTGSPLDDASAYITASVDNYRLALHYESCDGVITTHPLGQLICTFAACFNISYGSLSISNDWWPILAMATAELLETVDRLYKIIVVIFPRLASVDCATPRSVVLPHLMPAIYSTIFTLYTATHSASDADYWTRIVRWNRHSDQSILIFLDVSMEVVNELKSNNSPNGPLRHSKMDSAVYCLQRIKSLFSPEAKLLAIADAYEHLSSLCCSQQTANARPSAALSMDILLPVVQFAVVKSRLGQLGGELHMIEDLVDSDLLTCGETAIMFTTLKAAYLQIKREPVTITPPLSSYTHNIQN